MEAQPDGMRDSSVPTRGRTGWSGDPNRKGASRPGPAPGQISAPNSTDVKEAVRRNGRDISHRGYAGIGGRPTTFV
jgi:hypothetical protein